ncbi:MAG: HAD family hydrolase [Clostridiaceae bacterium]|nr:HAD family hydrolase [Clostridiaceae bacterium]
MNVDSIIFDLDGTLWDSTEVVLKAWDIVLHNNKEIKDPITRQVLQGLMGMQVKQIGDKLFPYLEQTQQMKIMELCCKEELQLLLREGGILYPGLENVLKELSKSYSLFIVSNCQNGYIEAFLEYHKLGQYFKDIECAGNTGLVKGENIKKVMDKHNLKSSLYVGDTQADCDAARLANIPFIFANYGFGEVKSYDYVICKLEDILELLEY